MTVEKIDEYDWPDWESSKGHWPAFKGETWPEPTSDNLKFLADKINELIDERVHERRAST